MANSRPPPAGPAEPAYRPDIDGLRAIAVLAVVGFHAFPEVITGGFVGVDVFFVISGFLITGILLRRLEEGDLSFAEFYRARMRRIFPALAVVLSATFAIGWLVLLPDEYRTLGKHIVGGAAFVSNFVLWNETGYFDVAAEGKPLLHLWSLGIEEQFYLIWPALLWCAYRWRLPLIFVIPLILIGSFAINVVTIGSRPAFVFYWPFSRFWELMVGSLLAYASTRGWSRLGRDGSASHAVSRMLPEFVAVAGLALIVLAVVLLDRQSVFPGWWALLPTVGSVLVLMVGDRSRLIQAMLATRLPVGIGLISYPLYLWHWPLFSFAHIWANEIPSTTVRVGLVLLSVLLATVTYKLVETPIRFGAMRQRAIAVCSAMMAVAICLGSIGYLSRGLIFRFPPEIQKIAYYSYDFRSDTRIDEKCWLSRDEPFDGFANSCFQGRVGKPRVLIWGDSYAGRLYSGLLRVFRDSHDILQTTRDGCAPVFDAGYSNCISSNNYILDVIRKSKPEFVVMGSTWTQIDLSKREIRDKVVATVDQLHAAGVPNILVVGPPPHWTDVLSRLVYRYWLDHKAIPQRMTFGLNPYTARADGELKSIIRGPGVTYVSLVDQFCDAAGCLVFAPQSDVLTTSDTGHLTTPAAVFVAEKMKRDGLIR